MKRIALSALIFTFSLLSFSQDRDTKLRGFHKSIDSQIDIRQEKAPRIGISSSNYNTGASVSESYIKSVLKAGGELIIIPPITDVLSLRSIVQELDGLVLIGGVDFNPSYYNEKAIEKLGEVDSIRDISDLTLIKLATDWNVPILGICRGEQGLNVAFDPPSSKL